jgi:hypothetical protein
MENITAEGALSVNDRRARQPKHDRKEPICFSAHLFRARVRIGGQVP